MFDLDKWQEIWGMMQKNKLRTFLTAFGVFWGIFMLVLLLGAGKGMQNGVEGEFGRFATNSLWIWAGKTSIPHQGFKPGREIEFRDGDLEAIQREVNGVNLISPRNWLIGEFTLTYKTKNGSFSVMGVAPDYFGIDIVDLVQGRVFNRIDMKESRKVVILGKRAKEILFGDKEAIGEYINIKGGFFRVIGYFKKEGNNGRFEERVFIPIATYQSVYNPERSVQVITLTAQKGVSAKKVEDQVKNVLARRHHFSTKDDQAIGVNNTEEDWNRFQGLFRGIKLFVGVIGLFTLISGAIGVSNIMLIIVKERTKEIGIRKAIGATPFSIISLIMMESIVITSLSGYLGLLVGVGLLDGVRYLIDSSGAQLPYFTRPEVDLSIALAAVIILVIAGAIAGLIPALKAANIKPIEALRAD
jgi:putative ABC transport system permease protein